MADTRTAASIAMLEKLVAFDTVSRNSNLAFIDYVRDLLSTRDSLESLEDDE